MFLNLINKEEKENFLELVYKIASCDDEFSEEEEEILNNYKLELGIETVPDTKPAEKLIAYFADRETQLKKVVFFELYGMIMADGMMVDDENAMLEKIKEAFALGDQAYADMMAAADGLQKAYDAVYTAIFD